MGAQKAGIAVTTAAHVAAESGNGRGASAACEERLRLSVAARNYQGVPTLQALERISAIGFDTCDNFNWRDEVEFGIYRDNLARLGLAAGVLVINKVPDVNALGCSLVLPEEREGFLRELRLCIEAARQVDCTRLEALTGNETPGVPRQEQMKCAVETLRAAVPLLKAANCTVVVELLNNTVDHPGYFLSRVRDAVELIERVGSPRVRVLFDIYHVQIMEGNLIARIRENIDYIGQIHFADVPGRHEPETGEINFRNVFRAIYELGDRYSGYATAEYEPTDLTFRDLKRVKELATFEKA